MSIVALTAYCRRATSQDEFFITIFFSFSNKNLLFVHPVIPHLGNLFRNKSHHEDNDGT
jgi:hypothetical protein